MTATSLGNRLSAIRIATIGTSAGGIDALAELLPRLPADLPIPVAVVVHVPPDRPSLLPQILSAQCKLPVVHARDGQQPMPGTVYVAPPGHHLRVGEDGAFHLHDGPPRLFARPAVDELFESVAQRYGEAALGIVLTGANRDGAKGLAAIAAKGGVTLVQAPDEALVRTMPEAAIAAADPDGVRTLQEIGRLLSRLGAKTASTRRPKLLLVDDIAENLVALEALLQEEEVEILKASSGPDALELLLRHEVALALIDVHMPEMDGFELAELMRGSARTRSTPIIFVTAGAREQSRIFRGYEAGAVDYLLKPIEPLVLRNKVRTFLQLWQQRQQLGEQVLELQRISAERARLVGDLKETLRLNELFLGALGHDLRSPVTAIQLSGKMIGRTKDEAALRRIASRIDSSSGVIAQMLETLLDLVQARQGGGIRLRTESIDLAQVAEAVLGEQRMVAADRQIDVSFTGALQGSWDPSRIHRLLSNLVSNAVRHGSTKCPVRVQLDGSDPDEVRVRVHNGGVIPAAILPQLFNPFRSGETGRAGLGLGLYIVREIAQAHGGDVRLHSSEAEGTTCAEAWFRRVVHG